MEQLKHRGKVMMQGYYFYVSDTRRFVFAQVDGHAMLTEQCLRVREDIAAEWVDVQKTLGVEGLYYDSNSGEVASNT